MNDVETLAALAEAVVAMADQLDDANLRPWADKKAVEIAKLINTHHVLIGQKVRGYTEQGDLVEGVVEAFRGVNYPRLTALAPNGRPPWKHVLTRTIERADVITAPLR
jgi:hypothetical protein